MKAREYADILQKQPPLLLHSCHSIYTVMKRPGRKLVTGIRRKRGDESPLRCPSHCLISLSHNSNKKPELQLCKTLHSTISIHSEQFIQVFRTRSEKFMLDMYTHLVISGRDHYGTKKLENRTQEEWQVQPSCITVTTADGMLRLNLRPRLTIGKN